MTCVSAFYKPLGQNNVMNRFIQKHIITAIIILLMCAIAYFATRLPIFQIAHINVQTTDGVFHHASQERIFQAVRAPLSGSLFTVNLNDAKRLAEQQEWVKTAQLTRASHNTISINITEHTPKARWIRDGLNAGLIDQDGEIFQAALKSNEPLLELDGEATAINTMLAEYEYFKKILKPFRLNIKRLKYTSRGAWSITLNNHIEIRLGKENTHTRLNNFVKIWASEWRPQEANIDYIDMRYNNGAAVGWLNKNPLESENNTDNATQ